MRLQFMRSRSGFAAATLFTIAASGAGAATVHRLAVTQGAGSGGATAFVQSSTASSALQGEVAPSANTSIKIPFGVLGEYDATGSTFEIGVAGISTTGYAVGGEALGASPAVLALNKGTGDGLDAAATSSVDTATGVYATSVNGTALYGQSGLYGVFGVGGQIGVLGNATGVGIEGVGRGNTGVGLFGQGQSGSQDYPVIEAYATYGGTDIFDAVVLGSDNNNYNSLKVSYPSANTSGTVSNALGASSDLAINGDIYLSGGIFTNCGPLPTHPANCTASLTTAAVHTSRGETLTAYASHSADATMEDEGEVQLVNGFAHVALDPAYASTISIDRPYLVFTTPLGDCRGLYVSHRTPQGFDVRELQGGRASLMLDYRIVAHPYGDRAPRLAKINHSTFKQQPIDARARQVITDEQDRQKRLTNKLKRKNVPDLLGER